MACDLSRQSACFTENGPDFFLPTFGTGSVGEKTRVINQHSNPECFMVNLLQVADSNGTTLLHVAARAGSFQVVKASIGVVVHGARCLCELKLKNCF